MEDCDLLKGLKKNDGQAFEELYRKYIFCLQEYAHFYTSNRFIAEDIVHDVFYKIWDKRKTLEIHTSLKSYLYSSVHNNCIQYLRHLTVVKKQNVLQMMRLEEALVMNRLYFESGLNRLFEKDIENIINETVNNLPEKTREIYLFSRKHRMKNSLIAEKYGITEKAVEYHITRALKKLRLLLKDYL